MLQKESTKKIGTINRLDWHLSKERILVEKKWPSSYGRAKEIKEVKRFKSKSHSQLSQKILLFKTFKAHKKS